MICQGITIKSTPCKNRAIANKNYCRCHGPPVPITPIIYDWISSSDVIIPQKFVKNYTTAFYHITSSIRESDKNNNPTMNRFLFFKITNILLKSPSLLKTINMQPIINMCIIKMKPFPHLKEYREYFARKLSINHRDEARKKFVNSIISESILGQDIASVIVGFM